MNTTSLALVVGMAALLFSPAAAAGREIPVYPGAKLVLEPEPGEEPACCDFSTRDAFEKVIAFYEKALRVKGLEPRAFGQKYPHLKHHTDALLQQMPAGMKIRIFPLSEMAFQSQKGVEIFEVTGTAAGARFNLGRAQLTEQDRHFADECELGTVANERRTQAGGSRAVSTAQLKAALPPRPPAGFTADAVHASTSSGSAFVQASYEKQIKAAGPGAYDAAVTVSIDVQITDVTAAPEEGRERIMVRDAGDRKILVRRSHPGKERIDRDGKECQDSEIVFLVHDRFLVEVRGSGVCDLPLLRSLIDSMDLGALPR